MSDDMAPWATTPRFPEAEATREAMAAIFLNAWRLVHGATERAITEPQSLNFDPVDQARSALNFGLSLASQPQRLADLQLKAWQDWSSLWNATLRKMSGQDAAPVIEPARGDRRFADPAWKSDPFYAHLMQAYLLAGRQLNELVDGVEGLDPALQTRVSFMVRQYVDAVAPTNFPGANPAAVRRTLETGGANLLSGLANLLADAASGRGLVERRSGEDFELGVNIAATPGSVIYQNALFQLIQYAPATAEVARRPLLYVPPLVNKYYLLDLQPRSSLLKWLVDQGRTVFAISWVNPDASLRDKDLASYIVEGVVEAVKAVGEATGETDVDVAAFCMGGTLAAAAAAYLAASGEGDRIGSLTLIGTLLDFSEMGDWAVFMDEGGLRALDRTITPKGYAESHDLQKLFSVMRANDLIWSSVINHYLLDKQAPPSDILFWFADGARIPAAFLTSYGELLLKGNLLQQPGGVIVGGKALDLTQVKAPAMLISLKDDHVSAWAATYKGALLFGGPTRFLLGGSGHNAGVINPPSANKHGFWVSDELPDAPEAWMIAARNLPGSWWPEWDVWMTSLTGDKVSARDVGGGKFKALEPAPGSYVRVR